MDKMFVHDQEMLWFCSHSVRMTHENARLCDHILIVRA